MMATTEDKAVNNEVKAENKPVKDVINPIESQTTSSQDRQVLVNN